MHSSTLWPVGEKKIPKTIPVLRSWQTKPDIKCHFTGCQKGNLDALSTFACVASGTAVANGCNQKFWCGKLMHDC